MRKSGENMRARRRVARVVCLGVLAGAGLAFGQQQYAISTVAGGAPPATPAVATGISVGEARRVTMDSAGNLYFSSLNSVFKVNAGGTLTLIAGNSRAGYSGDGGPATQAQLTAPAGLTFDQSGDLYIADAGNNVVREVTPNGIIQTVAGNGTIGYTGDQGPATQAQLHTPSGVAVDSSDNLYIADTANNVIREVTGGIIVTFAGDGYANYYGDDNGPSCTTASPCAVPPTRAEFHGPEDVTVGANGGIYIVDTGNSYIRVVAGGAVSFVAGSGAVGYSGDGGSATAAASAIGGGVQLYDPQSIAFDSAGNYYIADTGNNRIRKVNTKGIISTVAGNGTPGFAGDGGPATSAELNQPTGVFVDSQGNLYIADNLNNRVRKVSSSGTISTVAGNGTLSYSGDGGPAIAAQLNAPSGVALGAPGTLFISDSQNGVARIVNQAGISSIGHGSLVMPRGMATDAAENAYVADSQANLVWRIGTDGSVTKFAGTGTLGYGGDGGPAASAQLNAPTAVAVDTAGDVFIADFGNQRIREVTTAGTINTVAGNGSQGYSGDGGPAANASLNQAQGIAVDSSGNLYIADTGNNVIREVTANGTINTIAGTGSFGYSGDGGPAINAQLTGPPAVAVDAGGNIYFIDGTTWIRMILPNGTISTIAGNGSLGYSGDAGIATKAQLNSPTALAVDSSGDIYIADTGNNSIRRLQPVAAGVTVSAVTNAASNQQGAIAPGEIVVLYGSGLGPSQAQSYQLGANGLVPTNVGGTSVVFNGVPGPVLYASPTQVSAIVPFELVGQTVQVAVEIQNQIAAPVSVALQAAAPGIFTTNESGQGQAVAFNQDYSQNAAANPAAQGSQLVLYLTGGGQMSNSTDGSFAAPPLPLIPLPVSVNIGGATAQVKYAGAAPGQVAGLVEIAVEVPSGIQAGSAVPVAVTIGGTAAQSGVTVAIGQ
jgi:trimeric autotransporter adhesin